MEKAAFDRKSEHAPPANRSPAGNGAGGGRRGELLHLTEVFPFFFCVPVGQRSEEAEILKNGNQSRINEKIKKGHADYCVCQLEVMEQRRTGGRIKEGV